MQPLAHPILVGVTGAGENTDALRYAISEARTLGAGLMLVHALHQPLPPPPPSVLIVDADWSEIGNTIVNTARRELEELLGDESLPVTTAVHQGHPGKVLGDLSADATMIVLQHRDLSRLHRIVTGSTVAAVATHARCPVVSVPAARTDHFPISTITVGVHSDGGPRPVLEEAFAAAAAHHRVLRLVHAWRMPSYYDDMLSDDLRWTDADQAAISAAITELQAKYPDVDVDVDIRHDWPADALVGAAERSDLLVVGRHDGTRLTPVRLGSLARTVIAHASCPVMVVPV